MEDRYFMVYFGGYVKETPTTDKDDYLEGNMLLVGRKGNYISQKIIKDKLIGEGIYLDVCIKNIYEFKSKADYDTFAIDREKKDDDNNLNFEKWAD